MRNNSLFALFLVAACGTLSRHPVPPADKLRTEDCELAVATYRRLLALPAHSGTVIIGREVPVPTPEEQEQAATTFTGQCHYQFANRARRAILACWTDSPDVVTFRACNDRF